MFALDSGFNDTQVAIFCGIFKDLLENALEKNLPPEESIKNLKSFLLTYSDKVATGVFTPTTIDIISKFAMTTFFQHYNLIMYVYSCEQEKETMEMNLDLIDIPPMQSLDDAIPLAEHEAQQLKIKQDQDRIELEEQLLREQERLLLLNPFEDLQADTVKSITAETIRTVLQGVDKEFDRMLSEQKDRFVSMIGSRYKE